MENQRKAKDIHKPVMVSEVISALNADKYAHLKNSCLVDATIGLAGHSKEFVKRGVFVIGIDQDAASLKFTEDILKKACPTTFSSHEGSCFKLIHGNFSEIETLVTGANPGLIVGVLFDLGISSFQLDDPERGLSFRYPEYPLDMRLDKDNQKVKASDMLALLDKKELKGLFAEVLPEYLANRIAVAVVKRRIQQPINTTGDFLEVVRPVLRRKGKIDSATLPFLALRLAVNSENENLKKGLEGSFNILAPGGRLAVISFHSGEDRIVKNFFRKMEAIEKGLLITKKPVIPNDAEILENKRARSAKMRILEKL